MRSSTSGPARALAALAALTGPQSGRSRGETPWDAHWTAGDLNPHRWTYWSREPLAYQSGLPGAYAGSGITAPACLGAQFRERSRVLLFSAGWARQALDLADELGL